MELSVTRKDKPKVSIVTPSLNQYQFIEDTILSVLKQDYTDVEHIIVDGGSSDRTIDILRHYENVYNLRWISETDKGQADAINKGFELANGDIIGWINSDDTYAQGAISLAVNYLSTHPDNSWVYGDGYWIDRRNKVLRKWTSQKHNLYKLIVEGQYIVQPTVFFYRHILDEIGLLDVNLQYAMDTDFLIRISMRFTAGYITEVLATRRLHPEAKSVGLSHNFGRDRIEVLDKVFVNKDLPVSISKDKNIAYSNRYASWGLECFLVGNYLDARKYLWQALKLDPNPLKKKTLAIAATLVQSYFGVQWHRPGRRSVKKKEEAFTNSSEIIYVDWYHETSETSKHADTK